MTEEMISSIGRLLPLKVARSRLIALPACSPGEHDIRFMSKIFLRRGEELIHGVELAARYLDASKEELHRVFNLSDKTEERNFYTIDLILDVLRDTARDDDEYRKLKDGLGRMMAFDAVVGVQDRHAENWGVIENNSTGQSRRFAPVYDTARGLFCTHLESDLEARDREGRREEIIRKYANRSTPVFGCHELASEYRISHFQMVEYMVTHLREDLRPSVSRLIHSVKPDEIWKMLQKKFSRIVTRRRLQWIDSLLRLRVKELRSIVERTR